MLKTATKPLTKSEAGKLGFQATLLKIQQIKDIELQWQLLAWLYRRAKNGKV